MDWVAVIDFMLSVIGLSSIFFSIYVFIHVKKESGYGTGCIVALGTLVLSTLGIGTVQEKLNGWNKMRLAKKEKQVQEAMVRQQEAARIAEAKRIQEEEKRIQEAKDDKIRSFALKDAPKVWAVYQTLQSEIDVQNGKIEKLRKTLVSFDKDPERDVDFQRICALRDEMVRSRHALRTKLEDAYIASRKYEASPSRKDYQELHKKALEDGILEADAAEAKFKEMRLNK